MIDFLIESPDVDCVSPLLKHYLPDTWPVCTDPDKVYRQGAVIGDIFLRYAQFPEENGCALPCLRNTYSINIQSFYGQSLGSVLPSDGELFNRILAERFSIQLLRLV